MKRGHIRGLALVLLSGAMLVQSALAAAAADRSAAATAAAEQAEAWLEAMDGQRWDDGWKQAAAVVHESTTEQDWVREFGARREVLGKVLMRELKRADYSTTVRGAPEGEYVIAVFLTQFSHRPPASETVLLVRERGQWHVGGYNLGPPPPDAAPSTPPAPIAPAPAQPK